MKRQSIIQRFWRHVEITSTCWVWRGSLDTTKYGRFQIFNRNSIAAHRFAYAILVGPIPKGMDVDHLCHNADKACKEGNNCPHRRCVNPMHLEAVPHQTNVARGRQGPREFCRNGHRLAGRNAIVRRDGRGRECRACGLVAAKAYRQQRQHLKSNCP